jgi:hypothetical protein
VANSPNHPNSQSSSGGLRRGIAVAIVGSGIAFLLAFTGLTTYSSRTDGSNLPKVHNWQDRRNEISGRLSLQ